MLNMVTNKLAYVSQYHVGILSITLSFGESIIFHLTEK